MTASLICDGGGHPVDDPERIKAVQDSTRELDGLIDAELRADASAVSEAVADPSQPVQRVAESSGAEESVAASLDPGFHARALGIATEMVAEAALEAAGSNVVIDRRLGAVDALGAAPVRPPDPLPSVVSLGMVPQRRARRRRVWRSR